MAGMPGFAPGHAGPAPAKGGGRAAPVNPLLNPNATLSGPALMAAAQALARAQTQPALTALAQQIGQQQTQTQNASNLTNGYFQQLGNMAQQGVTDEKGISDALNQKLADLASSEQGQIQGIGQNATNTLNSYLPPGDQSIGQAGQAALTAENARQQGIAAQQEGNSRALGAQLGSNYQGLAAGQLGTIGLKGQEDLNQLAQAGQVKIAPLNDKVAQLQQTYGADVATALGKLRQQQVANEQAAAALGIKQYQAQTVAANDAAGQKIAAGKLGVAQGQLGVAKTKAATAAANQAFQNDPTKVGSAAWARVQNASGKAWSDSTSAVGSPAWARVQAANARANGGGAKPLSTVENNTYWAKTSTVEQLIKDGEAKGGTPQQIIDGLVTGQNPAKTKFDGFQVQIAMSLLKYGAINQTQAAQLHNQYGVRGGTYNGQPIRVQPDYKPPITLPQTSPAGGVLSSLPGVGGGFGG